MWELKQLQDKDAAQVCINGKWVPARPENYKPKYLSLRERLRIAYNVFIGKAEAFTWPEGQ
ncbi:hypothetical protein KAR91_16010 [Candidatus Pacearchaeota archaeon]|nr:hypothetical protein [Candidatus Pacearchaeota archaeon]